MLAMGIDTILTNDYLAIAQRDRLPLNFRKPDYSSVSSFSRIAKTFASASSVFFPRAPAERRDGGVH